jgi:hypothetical protein
MRQSISTVVLALAAVASTEAHGATLQVFGNASATALDTSATSGSGFVGGTDYNQISTNTAGSAASGAVTSSMTTPVGSASAFASANIATGQIRASASANGGTYYTNIGSQQYWTSSAGAAASALMSETFTAVGSGTVTFSLAYNGSWNVAGQPYVSCCDPLAGVVSGVFNPSWLLNVGLTLGGNGVLDSAYFTSVSPSGPASGSIGGILTATGSLVAGGTYGISSVLDLFLSDSIGLFDFSHTATLSVTTSPGLLLAFDDPRFLTSPVNPAPVPLPASALALSIGVAALGMAKRARPRRIKRSKP